MHPRLRGLLCTYVLIKHLFGCTDDFRRSDDLKTFLLRCLLISVTLLVYTIIGSLFAVLFVLHHLVDVYLRIKHGPAYGGMLKRQDSSMMYLKDIIMMRSVLILNQDEEQPDVWTSCLENARKFHSTSYKLSSQVKSCLGYSYYLKDQTKFEDVVEVANIGNGDHITKEELLDYINNVLPTKDNEKRLWSMLYFTQPIYWNHKSKTTKQYVCIFSFNHCLSDGPNLMKYVMEHLLDKGSYKPPQSNVLLNNLKSTLKLSIDDAYICKNPLYQSADGFPQLNENPGDKEYTAIYSEDTEKYLNLIKQVKTKIGVGFNSVLMGALSSSLTDYLKKKNKPLMDLTLVNVIRPEEINLVFKSNDEDPLINDVGQQTIIVPATQINLDTSKRLHAINESLKQVRRSLDSTTSYTISKCAHILPSVLQRVAMRSYSRGLTSMITNMSSVKDLSFGGYLLEAVYFFVTNPPPAFSVGITSLNGRLQLTLHASGLYVSNRKELQEILHGTLEYIDKFANDLQIE